MPLPLTNLSLTAIHQEVDDNATSTTSCSLNDSDIRGIGNPDPVYAGSDGINTTSNSTISIGEFRNAEDAVDVQTILVGKHENETSRGDVVSTEYGFTQFGTGTFAGSISDGTCDWAGGKAYDHFMWIDIINSSNYLRFRLNGSQANSGFTTLEITSPTGVKRTYSRTSASYSTSSSVTSWLWLTNTNPFNTSVGVYATAKFFP